MIHRACGKLPWIRSTLAGTQRSQDWRQASTQEPLSLLHPKPTPHSSTRPFLDPRCHQDCSLVSSFVSKSQKQALTEILAVPCNSNPQVSLTFGGKDFALSADTFNFGPVSAGSSDCVGGVQGTSGIGSKSTLNLLFQQHLTVLISLDSWRSFPQECIHQ
jgi:hypothetical protein